MPWLHPLVILPTYNEAENLGPMAAALLAVKPALRLLVVDDASPDGTGELADRLAAANSDRIEVLHRPRREGLGLAYAAAFAQALRGDCDAVVQMDADFSHPPELVPFLLEALADRDLVLGSRYVPGGGIRDWSLPRRFLSRAANAYARGVLAMPIRDLTGGFKAMRRAVVEYLSGIELDSRGYFFQIETTARAHAAGFRVQEIPLVFTERKRGVSKMSGTNIGEAIWKTLRLRKDLSGEPYRRPIPKVGLK